MNSPSLSYTDLNAMAQMKVASKADDPENMERVARQFESLFLNVMVKSMRDANQAFAEGNPLNTPQTRFYQDMYDSQLSVHLAEKQGLGLADVMLRQLSPQKVGPSVAAAPTTAAEGNVRPDHSALLARRRLALSFGRGEVTLGGPAAAPSPVVRESPADTVASVEPSSSWQPLRALRAAAQSSSSAVASTQAKTRFDSPAEFAAAMLPMAEKAAARLGVDPHYLVAQAALETGWGKSIIRGSDGSSSHNLFGIKTHGQWQGDSANVLTSEYRNGVRQQERATFRSYESYEQSFNDYVDFLQSNGRYQQALSRTGNADAFFRELQQAGYATDPRYASKVSQIARKLINDNVTASVAQTTTEGRA
ncbi:flagellar assembly peptidoglycan hydrolase FlgJ [Halopseudomonas xiamenensis]|uniref:flagellar assembly peptidoglycan hydrolase FlgJ n=1 Tax=Halopseudomonas xiamenensis TaxID=157792 RepID=UPI0016255D26|nr:flagellar assembly peptidoglycan hydrolase FlgJ [Halopseudomonas xiamenensis]